MSKKTTIRVGTIRTPKSRDLVHLQEITHGTGAGAHRSARDYNRQRAKRELKRDAVW